MKRMLFVMILLPVMFFAQGAGRYLNNSEVSQSFKERYFSKGEHDFFPMHIGDLWQYVYYNHDTESLSYFIHKIRKDTLVDGKTYFALYDSSYSYYWDTTVVEFLWWLREDNEGVLRVLDIHDDNGNGIYNEALLGDSLEVSYETEYSSYLQGGAIHIVRDTMWYVIDNDTLFTRLVFTMGGESFHTDKIGITMIWPEQNEPIYLTGAIINGVTYGTLVGIDDEQNGNQPAKFELLQNYPNPFNPTTTINYVIARSKATRQSHELSVRLTVYDILGREVATLVNRKQAPGKYSVQFDASKLSSGIYFYTLRAGEFTATKKMILMR